MYARLPQWLKSTFFWKKILHSAEASSVGPPFKKISKTFNFKPLRLTCKQSAAFLNCTLFSDFSPLCRWISYGYMYRDERVLGIITIKIWTLWKKQFQKSVVRTRILLEDTSRHFDIPAKFQTSADLLLSSNMLLLVLFGEKKKLHYLLQQVPILISQSLQIQVISTYPLHCTHYCGQENLK